MRDVFSKVKEEEDTEWNYLARYVAPLLKQYIMPVVCFVNRFCSFDDVSNKDFNTLLIRNVLSVTEGTRYNFNMVKSKQLV